jgi:ElaB/YqjD/DUF883 family membrane-anchored ribosome-binding protein
MKQMEQELKDAEENTQGLEEQIHKKDKRACNNSFTYVRQHPAVDVHVKDQK